MCKLKGLLYSPLIFFFCSLFFLLNQDVKFNRVCYVLCVCVCRWTKIKLDCKLKNIKVIQMNNLRGYMIKLINYWKSRCNRDYNYWSWWGLGDEFKILYLKTLNQIFILISLLILYFEAGFTLEGWRYSFYVIIGEKFCPVIWWKAQKPVILSKRKTNVQTLQKKVNII